jgi:hypothetical protein
MGRVNGQDGVFMEHGCPFLAEIIEGWLLLRESKALFVP